MMHVQGTCTRAVERCNREVLRDGRERRCAQGVERCKTAHATAYSSCDSLEVEESTCDSLACRVLEVRGQSGERGERGER
jgi:hypothetical protein